MWFPWDDSRYRKEPKEVEKCLLLCPWTPAQPEALGLSMHGLTKQLRLEQTSNPRQALSCLV